MKKVFFIFLFLILCSNAFSAIAYRSSSLDQNNSSSSCTVTKPTGVVDDDVMIASIYGNGSATITPPTGWTLLQSITSTTNWSAVGNIYYKVASSEGSDYTFTFSTTRNTCGISAFSGVDTSDVVDVYDYQINATGAGYTAPTITATEDDNMLVYMAMVDTNVVISFTPPSGMTEALDTATTEGPMTHAYELLSSSGATGTRTATGSNNSQNVSFLITLNHSVEPETESVVYGAVLQGCTIN